MSGRGKVADVEDTSLVCSGWRSPMSIMTWIRLLTSHVKSAAKDSMVCLST